MKKLACLLLFACGVTAFAADPPKGKKDKPPTPQQIAAAELQLRRMNCAVQRSTATGKKFWEQPVPKPGEVAPPADIIGFPNDTSDADLVKLLPHAKILPGIKTVVLWKTANITAAGLKQLAADMPYLSGIVLTDVTIRGNDLRELAGIPSLTWMNVAGSRIGDAGLKELAAIPRLNTLTLGTGLGITELGVAELNKAAQLRDLTINIADEDTLLDGVVKLTNIASLHIAPVGNSGARKLAKMDGLISLDLTSTDLDEDGSWIGRTNVNGMAANRGNGVSTSDLSDIGLKYLADIKSLTKLRASSYQIKGEDIAPCTKLENLVHLDLPYTGVSDASIASLIKIKTLRHLSLMSTQVTDDGVRDLADLPRLETLNLGSTRIGDRAVQSLVNIRSLVTLQLDQTNVALNETVNFGSLSALKYLSLQVTNVNAGSFKSLQTARVASVIDLRYNCPNLMMKDVKPLQTEMPGTRVLADYGCYSTYAWPGAMYYPFKVPESKSTEREAKSPPPKPMPAGPPPKTAPNVGGIGGGTSKKN